MRGNWGNSLKPVKRALSEYEKASFPVAMRDGRILLMPAEPNTEVEELLQAGAEARNIIGIEIEQAAADALYEHYFDTVCIHWIDLNTFIERAMSSAYAYAHLDWCGFFGEEELHAVAGTARILAPMSRLRVTLLRNRKTNGQVTFEQMVRESMLLPMVNHLARNEAVLGWDEMASVFAESTDATQLVAAVVILSHYFGIDPWKYADEVSRGQTELPEPVGNHMIYNVQRWTYNEISGRSAMETVWFDLMHAQPAMSAGKAQMLYPVLHSLTLPPNDFSSIAGKVDEDISE